jgi:hypothetical protein
VVFGGANRGGVTGGLRRPQPGSAGTSAPSEIARRTHGLCFLVCAYARCSPRATMVIRRQQFAPPILPVLVGRLGLGTVHAEAR